MERLPPAPINFIYERARRRPDYRARQFEALHDAVVTDINNRHNLSAAEASSENIYHNAYNEVIDDIIERGIEAVIERLQNTDNSEVCRNLRHLYDEMKAEHITPFDILEYLQPEIEQVDELLGHQLQDALEEMRLKNRSPQL